MVVEVESEEHNKAVQGQRGNSGPLSSIHQLHASQREKMSPALEKRNMSGGKESERKLSKGFMHVKVVKDQQRIYTKGKRH
jgi:hypothetical protein